ncbi:hypothetical protein VNO78_03990 [Psophocarpus tetragonolobus]|uniref:Senescence regulator n=1 Tax=Psophocarpus tetragonolobus TaxID=3891 RepID=A0AAN9TEA0_PSOTE
MAEEEFTEYEVVFHDHNGVSPPPPPSSEKDNYPKLPNSMPVNIPQRVPQRWPSDEEEADKEITPPHEIVRRRRVTEKMAFSVCTGNGRTLKGRDLSQVRNSILRLTGFLEA